MTKETRSQKMKIDEFIVEFLFQDKGFEQGVDKADKKLSSVAKTAIGVGTAIVAAFTSNKVLQAISHHTGELDSLIKTADKLGVAFSDFQELGFVGEQNGIEVSKMNTSIEKLIKNVTEARELGTGEGIQGLELLGLNVDDLDGQSIGDQFEIIADKMKGITEQGVKVTAAYKLFGRSGTDLVNILQQGGDAISRTRQEARDLGIILGEDLARESEKYGDTMNRLTRVTDALKKKIFLELAPVIERMITGFVEWWKINGKITTSRIVGFFNGLADTLSFLIFIISNTVKNVWFLFDSIGGLSTVLMVLATVNLPLLISILGKLGFVLKAFKITAILLALDDFITYLRGGESVIGDFVDRAKTIHPVLGIIADLAAKAGVAVGVLALIPKGLAAAALVIKGLITTVGIFAGAITLPFAALAGLIGASVFLVVSRWDKMKHGAKALSDDIVTFFTRAINSVSEKWTKMIDYIVDLVPDFIKDGVEFTGEAFSVAGNIVKENLSGAYTAGTQLFGGNTSSTTNSNVSSSSTVVNKNDIKVEIKGDASGLTQDDVKRGVSEALSDLSMGGLTNTGTSYR